MKKLFNIWVLLAFVGILTILGIYGYHSEVFAQTKVTGDTHTLGSVEGMCSEKLLTISAEDYIKSKPNMRIYYYDLVGVQCQGTITMFISKLPENTEVVVGFRITGYNHTCYGTALVPKS